MHGRGVCGRGAEGNIDHLALIATELAPALPVYDSAPIAIEYVPRAAVAYPRAIDWLA